MGDSILGRFPKQRPPLPPEHRRIYAQYYEENRQGKSRASSLSTRLEKWMHRAVAADLSAESGPRATLEIGGGTLNHLPYEPASQPYDVVEPMPFLYAGSPLAGRVRNFYGDTSDIPGSEVYDRVLSIATFEHICDLPAVVARAGLLLKPGGQLRVGIPSEGTCLWALGWRCTTGLEFRLRHGLSYGTIMRHEHVNSAREVTEVLGSLFGRVDARYFGIGPRFSLYQVHLCSYPDLVRCGELLAPGD